MLLLSSQADLLLRCTDGYKYRMLQKFAALCINRMYWQTQLMLLLLINCLEKNPRHSVCNCSATITSFLLIYGVNVFLIRELQGEGGGGGTHQNKKEGEKTQR